MFDCRDYVVLLQFIIRILELNEALYIVKFAIAELLARVRPAARRFHRPHYELEPAGQIPN
jgi:hypothetical protein